MQRIMAVACVACLSLVTGIAVGQDAKVKEQGPEQEIRKLLKNVEDSFSSGDAKGLAACWTPTGDFIDHKGEHVQGRAAIEEGFQESFAARKNGKLQLTLLSLRLVNSGLALADAIASMKPAEPALAGGLSFSFVLVKSGERWLIENARETTTRVASPAEHMKDLEWMVGDWAQEPSSKSDIALHSECGWTDNKAFLIRKFTVEGKDGVLHAGTEVIGWDPRIKMNRSWVFDSNGGVGENMWLQDGKRWLIKYSGTLADGSEVSATNIITVVDANTITLQSKDRTVNGKPQGDIPEITLKRSASKDAAKPVTQETVKPKVPNKPQPRALP